MRMKFVWWPYELKNEDNGRCVSELNEYNGYILFNNRFNSNLKTIKGVETLLGKTVDKFKTFRKECIHEILRI